MIKETLINQIAFENWANEKLLSTFQTMDHIPERALLLFSHIMSVNNMWISRLQQKEIKTSLFQERTLLECQEQFEENICNWKDFFSSSDQLFFNTEIEFIFPIDQSNRKIKITDAIYHVSHHSSYHRGQIVSLLKNLVSPLPMLNYINYSSRII